MSASITAYTVFVTRCPKGRHLRERWRVEVRHFGRVLLAIETVELDAALACAARRIEEHEQIRRVIQ